MAILKAKPWRPILQRSHPLARGLSAAWIFNEGAGTILRDLVGNSNATTQNSPTWGMGLHGSTLSFNGTTQYAVLYTNVSPSTPPAWLGKIADGTGGYSFGASIKSTASTSIGATAPWSCGCVIVEARNTTSSISNHAWSFGMEGGKLSTARTNSTNNATDNLRLSSSTSINDGLLHRVAATVSVNSISLYIDGRLDATGTFGPGATGNCSIGSGVSNAYIQIGARTTSAAAIANWWSQGLDNLFIWSRPLSPREVMNDYVDTFALFRQQVKNTAGSTIVPGPQTGQIIFGTA